jgi:hypothetical protein
MLFALFAAINIAGCHSMKTARINPLPPSIGHAEMSDDGTINLYLVAYGHHGEIGHGMMTYKAGDADYQMMLDHLGGLKPGERKPVAPWPEASATPAN